MAITPKDHKSKTVKFTVEELFGGELEMPTIENVSGKLILKLQKADELGKVEALIEIFDKYLPADEAEYVTNLSFEDMGKVFEAWSAAQGLDDPKEETK